jgi:chromosomal replication initiator protein
MICRVQFGELNIARIKKYKLSPKVKVYVEKTQWSIDDIVKIVCTYFNVEIEMLKLKTRKREIVQSRQISMYLARKFTKFPERIISQIGNQNHSTTHYAYKHINELIETDKNIKKQVEELEEHFKTPPY